MRVFPVGRLAVGPLFAALVWLSLPNPSNAEVYYSRDASGAIHFSNVRRADAEIFREPLWPATPIEAARASKAFGEAVDHGAYDDIIAEQALRNRLEPALVKAVIRTESAFRPRAVSPKGARGLMQLMPATARDLGCRNVYDPEQNIEAGAKHLRVLIDQFGFNLPRVLAAYNAGASRVDRYRGIPPYAETRSYVLQVLRYRRDYLKRERLSALQGNLRGVSKR